MHLLFKKILNVAYEQVKICDMFPLTKRCSKRMTRFCEILRQFIGPFNYNGLTLIPAWISYHIHYEMWMKLIIHSQTSTGQPLEFGNV